MDPSEEIQAVSYLLETLDAEFTEFQEDLERATEMASHKGYFTLTATTQEITAWIIAYRLTLIGWGLAVGLTGYNTEEVLEDIYRDGIKKLPDVYHGRLNDALSKAKEFLKEPPKHL
jgi:hypothetical protein